MESSFRKSTSKFQSTLLQEERRNRLCRLSCKYKISIHAPTRGATLFFTKKELKMYISIHAPTRGATYIPFSHSALLSDFNPRSYKRSDKREGRILADISDFNPRSYKRSDEHGENPGKRNMVFQSTLLQEERLL